MLERIVTDGGYDLRHKIEALRDERESGELNRPPAVGSWRRTGGREWTSEFSYPSSPSAAVLMIPIFAIWTKHRKLTEMQIEARGHARRRPRNTRPAISELEDRVRVLERIVTDRGYDVATQIEALRDQRRGSKTTRVPNGTAMV